MSPELERLKEQLAALIVDTAGILHTQVQETERRLHTELQQGFERLDARLGRHGSLAQDGSSGPSAPTK
jgi:hypothetical protein